MNALDSGAPSAGSLARTELYAVLLPERKLDVKQTQPLNLSPEQLVALELIRSQQTLSLKKLLMLL